jgi:hypothetical protein
MGATAGEVAAQPGPPDTTCEAPQREARELLKAAQSCAVDADCVFASLEVACLMAFQCGVVVHRSTDLGALRARAEELSRANTACGGGCWMASCAGIREARCNPTSLRCEPALPVSAPAPVVRHDEDAGASVPPADSLYGCAQHSDCVIKDVRNCCGYYPRCANKDAQFEPPRCEGVGSVCGFPVIDRCECRMSHCVSLQGDQEI